MDLVALFAIAVFSMAWFFRARADLGEPLVRLFFATLMGLAAGIGLLGLILRLLVQS